MPSAYLAPAALHHTLRQLRVLLNWLCCCCCLLQDFASIATVALNQREAELLEMSQALVDQRKEVQVRQGLGVVCGGVF
jgi:hypothetical protein